MKEKFSSDIFLSPLKNLEQVLRMLEEFHSNERFEDMYDAFELIESYKKAVNKLKEVTE